ncbi:MAG: hypothetical protein J6C82_04870, partial [Clostridia bacterium]|nr:hypothetical protein [Clostridia bacterium]MBP1560766.1 hypothetical protein [Oscillospiraceae bacterium]
MIYLGNQKSGTLTLPQPGAATEKFVPRIGDNGNWYVYDFKENTYVDTGVSAQGPQGEQGEMGA